MIEISNLSAEKPYKYFDRFYKAAIDSKQEFIEAISIASFNEDSNEVESRYVNLKYIKKDEWIFFTNYNSPKARQFKKHDQISILFYWDKTNVQIRMKARISKSPASFSDKHFEKRSIEKNALAISSMQAQEIESHQKVEDNYKKVLNSTDKRLHRPKSWGGFSFTPYYFEFWEGRENRLNRRYIFLQRDGEWHEKYLQP